LGDNFNELLGRNFKKLVYLSLKDCPIQEDLSIMAIGSPDLLELDLSGDSWVHRNAFLGLSKHPNLKILRLGHFEHSDTSCDLKLKVFFVYPGISTQRTLYRISFLELRMLP
jgi:hypothetical protein